MDSCRQEYEVRDGYLLCRVIGPVDAKQVAANVKEIVATAKESARTRILADCSRTVLDRMTLSERLLTTFEVLKYWDFSLKYALWMPHDPLKPEDRDWAYEAANFRMLKVRGFEDYDEALQWLLSD